MGATNVVFPPSPKTFGVKDRNSAQTFPNLPRNTLTDWHSVRRVSNEVDLISPGNLTLELCKLLCRRQAKRAEKPVVLVRATA